MLLGCEKIIARMWWEMQNNMHAPMQLHELLASRVFDAAGNPNPLAQESKSNKVTLDLTSGVGTVNIPDKTQWSPKGVLSLLDALEAIEWQMGGTHHQHWDLRRISASPASKWSSCQTLGVTGQSHTRQRNSGHNILVQRAQTSPHT